MKEEDTVNLMDQLQSDLPQPTKKVDLEEDQFYPHWKREVYLNLVYDDKKYNIKEGMPSEIAASLKVNWDYHVYEPIVYVSDFW